MYIVGIIVLILAPVVAMDVSSELLFLMFAYNTHHHGKTWRKAKKHYKLSWNLLQRLLWVPVFKEYYEKKYRALAIMSHIHRFLSLVSLVLFFVDEFIVSSHVFWHYSYFVVTVIFFFRFFYHVFMARGKI